MQKGENHDTVNNHTYYLEYIFVTAILGLYNNHKEIEAIKSWYPFCEILKIKIPEKDDFERGEP